MARTLSPQERKAIQDELSRMAKEQLDANAAYDQAVRRGDTDTALYHLRIAQGLGASMARLGNSLRG